MPVTLEEAKTYLRVDSGDEDGLISDLISTAMQMCRDVARADDTVLNENAAITRIKTGFDNAVDFIKGLAKSAWNWGADIINGIVDGIKSCIGKVKDAVGKVAETIRSYLHFSSPDVGPLVDYESWMPDFMSGLSKGIESSRGLVSKAMASVAGEMVVSPQIKATGFTQTTDSSAALTETLKAIRSAVTQNQQDSGDICIPVYLGGTLLDEVIVNAQKRQNLRSGGR